MVTIKVAVCEHFLEDFREKLGDISIEENDNFDCFCENTFIYILIYNDCATQSCNCNIDQNGEHSVLQAFPSAISLYNY